MKILFVGDVVGSPGRRILKTVVARLRLAGDVHAVVVNAENAAAGSGITATLADEIYGYGVDVLTLGDHVWDQKDIPSYLERDRRTVRPANLPPGCPGRGWTTVQTEQGPLTVVSLLGRVFMNPCDCPFRAADELLKGPLPRSGVVLVDFHAEATSEKICMGWYLDGRISAVLGTHTHVQTSDARILPKGTAYLTDLGMTGPRDSVIGREIAPVTQRFVTGMPARFEVAGGPAVLEGALLDIDRTTGRAVSIRLIREMEDR
jgi:hypothetical protein